MDVELVVRNLHVIRDKRVRDPFHKVVFHVVVIFRKSPHFKGENKAACRLFAEHYDGRGIFQALTVIAYALHYYILGALVVLRVRHAEIEVYSARGFGVVIDKFIRGQVGIGHADGFVGGSDEVGIHYRDVFHYARDAFAGYSVAYLERAGDEYHYARRQIGKAALQGEANRDA